MNSFYKKFFSSSAEGGPLSLAYGENNSSGMLDLSSNYPSPSGVSSEGRKQATANHELYPYLVPGAGKDEKKEKGKISAKAQGLVFQSSAEREKIRGLVGHPVNAKTLFHFNSKSIVYSFKKVNNLHSLFGASEKIEYLLKSIFLSMNSLISRPVYLIRHDKVIIRLFVFLAPKADKFLDTSTVVKEGKIVGASSTIFSSETLTPKGGVLARRTLLSKQISKYLILKKIRPKLIEILYTQIKPRLFFTLNDIEQIVNQITGNRTEESLPALAKARGEIGPSSRNRPLTPLSDESLRAQTLSNPIPIQPSSTSPSDTYPYTSFSSTFKLSLEKLSEIFRKVYKKEVEFEIIKAQLPFQDSNILAQILGYNANNYKFRQMLKILIPRAVIKNPSKELSCISNSRPHKQCPLNYDLFLPNDEASLTKEKKNNKLFAQPASYLPPFFFSVKNLNLYLENLVHRQSIAFPPGHNAVSASSVFANEISLRASMISPVYPPSGALLPSLTQGTVARAGLHGQGIKEIGQPVRQKSAKFSYLSGMNIKLAGRLMTQSIRPRFTVQSKQEGSLARVKVHFTEKSRFTGKNKRGAYSFTVSISHVLNASH
jgi:hypothetical protein